jgi:hypothetical protein
MVKPNGAVWYGYSIYIPRDFVSLGRANTILSQAKVEKHGHPLWAMTFNEPIMPKRFAKQSQKIGLKYGIYSSLVSRYLSARATKPVDLKAYSQRHATGSTSKSTTPTPFKYDWGAKLPTHVIYYEEMR